MNGSVRKSQSFSRVEKRALAVKEAVETYGLSRSMLYRLMARGTLHSVRVGGRRLLPVDALEALLKGE
jgi:excisionase family DNA binding protein